MPLTIPSDWYEASFFHGFGGAGTNLVCTIAVSHGVGDPLDHVTTIGGLWDTHVMPAMTTSIHHSVTRIRDQVGTVAELVTDHGGALSGPMLPLNCCYLVKKLTGLPGRKQRGRMYIPGCIEGQVDEGGFWNSSAQGTALQTGVLGFKNAMQAASLPLGLLHNDPLTLPTHLTNLVVEPQIATQRRRLR